VKLLEGVRADAVLDSTGLYRYQLTRIRDAGAEAAVFIMLNPSTADAATDDLTLRKCQEFARRWRCGGVTVVNLFAMRATKPEELVNHLSIAVGPENDGWLAKTFSSHRGPLVAAWGTGGSLLGRDRHVTGMALECGRQLYRIGPTTQYGYPRHPSRASYELELQRHG
jgi:hypothetical protein